MSGDRPSFVWRLWLLVAQVIAVSAGLMIAWKAFGPDTFGKVAKARVAGTDSKTGLALPRAEPKGLQPLTPAEPKSVHSGDIVPAVGDPFGVGVLA